MRLDSDCVIVLGAYAKDLSSDVYLNPFLDSPTKYYIRYEAGTEEGVCALFLHEFCQNASADLRGFIDGLDFGYLTSETNISEEEISYVKDLVSRAKNPLLIVGSDVYRHKRSENILKILSCLKKSLNLAFLSQDSKNFIDINLPNSLPSDLSELPENNGCVVYVDTSEADSEILRCSSEFARIWKLKNGEKIEILIDEMKVIATCAVDSKMDGIIGILRAKISVDCKYKKAKFLKR